MSGVTTLIIIVLLIACGVAVNLVAVNLCYLFRNPVERHKITWNQQLEFEALKTEVQGMKTEDKYFQDVSGYVPFFKEEYQTKADQMRALKRGIKND